MLQDSLIIMGSIKLWDVLVTLVGSFIMLRKPFRVKKSVKLLSRLNKSIFRSPAKMTKGDSSRAVSTDC